MRPFVQKNREKMESSIEIWIFLLNFCVFNDREFREEIWTLCDFLCASVEPVSKMKPFELKKKKKVVTIRGASFTETKLTNN